MTHLRLAADPATVNASRLERSITVRAAAQVLACDDSTIREMLDAGKLRGHRVGAKDRGIRIYEASIREYREGAEITPKGERRAAATRSRRPSAEHAEAVAYLRGMGVLDNPDAATPPRQGRKP